MRKIIPLLALVVMVLQGCATSRSVVDAPEASYKPKMVSASAPAIYIRQVIDMRTFQESPRSADIPSLGFEGALAATEDTKARAIGRKRNSWGKAMGDVLLPEHESVEALIRDAASAGFQDAGWRVVQSPEPSGDVSTVDITIKQLWSWIQPGFWAISTNARIETEFDFSGPHQLVPVLTEYKDRMQFVTDSDWQRAIQQVLAQYRSDLAESANIKF